MAKKRKTTVKTRAKKAAPRKRRPAPRAKAARPAGRKTARARAAKPARRKAARVAKPVRKRKAPAVRKVLPAALPPGTPAVGRSVETATEPLVMEEAPERIPPEELP